MRVLFLSEVLIVFISFSFLERCVMKKREMYVRRDALRNELFRLCTDKIITQDERNTFSPLCGGKSVSVTVLKEGDNFSSVQYGEKTFSLHNSYLSAKPC